MVLVVKGSVKNCHVVRTHCLHGACYLSGAAHVVSTINLQIYLISLSLSRTLLYTWLKTSRHDRWMTSAAKFFGRSGIFLIAFKKFFAGSSRNTHIGFMFWQLLIFNYLRSIFLLKLLLQFWFGRATSIGRFNRSKSRQLFTLNRWSFLRSGGLIVIRATRRMLTWRWIGRASFRVLVTLSKHIV